MGWEVIAEDHDSGVLHIRGEVDGDDVDAFVSFTALEDRFNEGDDYTQTFLNHHGRIRKAAERKWRDGDVNEGGDVFLGDDDF